MRHGDFIQRMPPRVRIALLLSLLVHALLLRIFLGGQTFGLPGLDVFWKERRADAGDLRIELAPVRPMAPAAPPAPVVNPVPLPPPMPQAAPPVTPPVLRAPPPVPADIPPAPSIPVITSRTPSPVTLPVAPEQPAPVLPDPAIAQKQADEARQAAERTAQAERDAGLQAQKRQEDAARADQLAKEALAQQALARAEAARQDAARAEQTRQAAAQRIAKDEQARQAADKADAARREQARQDADHAEAARQAQAQAQAKQDQLKQDQLSQAQQERRDQEAKREERLQAIGAQMKQEAAQRDAPSRSLLPSASSLRRGLLLGRADANTELVKYAEAMGRKIELNQTMDLVRDVAKLPHAPPLVTVAIRADGSVEKVTFVVSSGVPALDEAIRTVIASQAPYGAFTPALARQYDVIEIRRTWLFENAIRLQ